MLRCVAEMDVCRAIMVFVVGVVGCTLDGFLGVLNLENLGYLNLDWYRCICVFVYGLSVLRNCLDV